MAEDRSLFYKDPDEVRDYLRDWTLKLGDDTITTSTWTLDDGITLVSESHTDLTATARISGGPTIGVTYKAVNRVVTAGGRTFDKTFKIRARAS
jgi:hypothetical protein